MQSLRTKKYTFVINYHFRQKWKLIWSIFDGNTVAFKIQLSCTFDSLTVVLKNKDGILRLVDSYVFDQLFPLLMQFVARKLVINKMSAYLSSKLSLFSCRSLNRSPKSVRYYLVQTLSFLMQPNVCSNTRICVHLFHTNTHGAILSLSNV